MGYKDWDPDDLLDFDYSHPVHKEQPDNPKKSSKKNSGNSIDSYDEFKRYEALRHSDRQAEPQPVSSRVNTEAAADKAKTSKSKKSKSGKKVNKNNKPEEVTPVKQQKPVKLVSAEDIAPPLSASRRSAEETAALKQAQQEAYDRYRSTYSKNYKKKNRPNKASRFTKGLSVLYLIALIAFLVIMTILDVLPSGVLIALYAVLILLSLIITIQLRKNNVKRWVRVVASLTSVALIGVYGISIAYAMGTLSFLDSTSVQNDKKVAHITKEPFNICITGMDVDGTIDTEGRSDVNMIVTVNPKTEQILMTSIPRDYEIYMPDKDNAMDKLTHTGFYSVGTTIGAEETLLDTTINYFVKVNFTTVKEFIDAIGGIDVYSEYEFTPVKLKSWTVQEGMNHMDGKQALAFARERKAFPTGDNQRIKNQQAVFEAIIEKATSSKTVLLSYNKIISKLKDYFQMSISSSEIRSLIKLQLSKSPEWKIYKNTIIGGDASLPTYSTGNAYAYVMTQDPVSIENAKTLINGVLEGKTLDKDDDGNVFVVGDTESTEEGL